MFIERVSELGLLEHSPSSNIIAKFPLDVKSALISQMNRYMVDQNPTSLLTSETHVLFVMELVGQGFNLPLHQLSIIELSVSVYSSWLLDVQKRPVAIQSDDVFQRFVQNIFKQASLVFRPRTVNEIHSPTNKKETNEELGDLIRQHVEICKKIISMYHKFMVESSHLLSKDTWIVILKVLLGVCDTLLKEPIHARKKGTEIDVEHSGSYMGDKLCELLIQLLIDHWLKCKVVPVDMWNRLKTYFMSWTHRVQMINQWKQTTLQLSKMVIGDLSERNRSVMSYISETEVPGQDSDCSIEEQRDKMYYSWHRILYMIQNPVLLDAPIFQTAIFGISKLVDEFMAFGLKLEKNDFIESPVNGNTLLNMFGEWLFDGGLVSKAGYEAGRAEATAVLCRIFSKLQRVEKFHTHYLRKFYNVIQQGLKSDFLTLSSIVVNSSLLFIMNLEGFRMLIPDYVFGLFRVLPTIQSPSQDLKMDPDELRRAAYSLLSNFAFSITLLGNTETEHTFPQMKIPEFADSPLQSWIDSLYENQVAKTFNMLKPAIAQILVGSLITESNPRNAKFLLNLIGSYCVHEAENNPGIYHIFIKVIQEKLLIPDHWSNDVILTSFDCLGIFLANMDTKHELAGPSLHDLVLVLCQFIDVQLRSENLVPLQVRISRAYDLLAKVALAGNWIVYDASAQKTIVTALVKGISILDRERAFSAIDTPTPESATAVPQLLSPNTVVSLGKLVENMKHEATVSFAPSTSSSGSTNSPALPRGRKTQSRLSLAPNKRFKNLRLSFQPNSMNMVSTGSKDGGVGLPTFALLSAEIQIKSSAELVMSLLCLRISNFPPKNSCQGVTRLSATWNEIQSIIRTSKFQQSLLEKSGQEINKNHRQFIRYFAYQKRVILGFIEVPRWLDDRDIHKAPTVYITTRDLSGRFAWCGKLEYVENSNRKTSLEISSGNVSDLAPDENQNAPKTESTAAFAFPNETTQTKVTGVNEANIPTIEELCTQYNIAELPVEIETLQKQSHFEAYSTKDTTISITATPFPIVDSSNPLFIPKTFRMLLASMGFLDYKLSSEITPLLPSENLDQDLEKLDQLPERDCYTILVLYGRTGDDRVESLFLSSSGSKEYERFLWSLGWPVQPITHLGFKGTISESIPITPYFANQNMEVIFKCPYLSAKEAITPPSRTSTIQLRRRTSSAGAESTGSMDELFGLPVITRSKGRQRSHSVGHGIAEAFEQETQEVDCLAVIWMEDIHNLNTLIGHLPSTILFAIVVHPIQDCIGIYHIRIICRAGAPEDIQNVGPLIDNMIIAEDGMASLLRQTSTNMIKSFKIMKNVYKRPTVTRRLLVEEICNRHAGSKNGLFADILSQ